MKTRLWSSTLVVACMLTLVIAGSPANATVASPSSATKADVTKLASLAELAIVANSKGSDIAFSKPPVKITQHILDHSVLSAPAFSTYPVSSTASFYINYGSLSFCVSEKDSSGHNWRLETSNQTLHLGKACTAKDVLANLSADFQAKAASLYQSVVFANDDAINIGSSVASLLADYTSFGTALGSITLTGSPALLTFDPMVNAVGQGGAVATGPGATATPLTLSAGSTLVSAGYEAGDTPSWCLVVNNGLVYAKYTNSTNNVYSESLKGYINVSVESVFGSPLKCLHGQG